MGKIVSGFLYSHEEVKDLLQEFGVKWRISQIRLASQMGEGFNVVLNKNIHVNIIKLDEKKWFWSVKKLS